MSYTKEDVYAYAMEKHQGQKRKDGTDYIDHPIRVASMVKDLGEDYEYAGLYHDLLEDTTASEDMIRTLTNDTVLEAVKLLTKQKGIPTSEYIKRILENPVAKVVKAADREDNLKDALDADVEFIKRYLQDTEKYYLGKFGEGIDKAYEELKQRYEDMTTYRYTIDDSLLHSPVYRVNKLEQAQIYNRRKNEWEDTDPYFWAYMDDHASNISEEEAMEMIAEEE